MPCCMQTKEIVDQALKTPNSNGGRTGAFADRRTAQCADLMRHKTLLAERSQSLSAGWAPVPKSAAGHDLNYIALTGLAGCIGPEDQKPVPPLNLVGDYGCGGMLVAFGMVAALLENARSGKGQTVDAAITEGASLLFGSVLAMQQADMWKPKRQNQTDGGAPYYQIYETSVGKYVSVGAIERKFFQ